MGDVILLVLVGAMVVTAVVAVHAVFLGRLLRRSPDAHFSADRKRLWLVLFGVGFFMPVMLPFVGPVYWFLEERSGTRTEDGALRGA